ncbi:MAG: 30S ribosomal protein S20 [Puniceicoccales bacterium]|jgi:small subunit ribosomal protein S20|nr:30S ribosomal protein S20 [Puniceicoccales bacterium]
MEGEMANLRSSKKDVRRTVSRTLRNRSARSELKTLAKKVLELGRGDGSREAAVAYASALDKAVKRGIIHRNRADRGKSALAPIIFSQPAK